jgi:hypothetical protein
MDEFDVKKGEWEVQKNGRIGKDGEKAIMVNKKPARKGLGMRSNGDRFTRVKYYLNQEAVLFDAAVAIPDTGGDVFGDEPVTVEVLCDDVSVWSKTLKRKGMIERCRIEVKDVRVLELRVSSGFFSADVAWIDPYVQKATAAAND